MPDQGKKKVEFKDYIKSEDRMAKALNVHKNTVRNWLEEGKIKCVRIGKVKYFDPDQIPG